MLAEGHACMHLRHFKHPFLFWIFNILSLEERFFVGHNFMHFLHKEHLLLTSKFL